MFSTDPTTCPMQYPMDPAPIAGQPEAVCAETEVQRALWALRFETSALARVQLKEAYWRNSRQERQMQADVKRACEGVDRAVYAARLAQGLPVDLLTTYCLR